MQIAIVGIGLIGGSLGLALRAADQGFRVTGWDRSAAVGERALERGAIERFAPALAEAVRTADVIVIATPVLASEPVLAAIAPELRPGTLVTDVASTKREVCEWASSLLPPGIHFVGGHPMAGSERHGVEHARADLFRGATYCLTPAPDTPPDAVERIAALVSSLGARPLLLDPAEHDAYVAAISHMPFVLSAALMRHAATDARWPVLSQLAATGFRDLTRLASGEPRMHRDIVLTNSAAVRAELRGMARLLDNLAEQLDDPDALESFLTAAQRERAAWLHERGFRPPDVT